MSSPVLWGPNYSNDLQSGIGFSNGAGPSIQTGTVNPSTPATAGVVGSLYLNSSTGATYQKQDNGTTTNWTAFGLVASTAPTVQIFTSGSGTYTLPSGPAPLYITVEMVGGGGGASGSGSSGGSNGSSGGNTTFGSSFLVANGGSGGMFSAEGGAGGTASLGSATGIALMGANGNAQGVLSGTNAVGGSGGGTPFGGAGAGAYGDPGYAGVTNTGSGGGGAGGTTYGGSGGGAGGYVKALITAPSSTYSYNVGTGGAAGAGGSGSSGTSGAGGSGIIIVTEYYQ